MTQEQDTRSVPVELLPCPFCGDTPVYSEAEEYDDRRYMVMTLECCAKMRSGIPYGEFKYMNSAAIKEKLRDSLAAKWNLRAIIDQPEEEAVGEFVRFGIDNYPSLQWHKEYVAKFGDKLYLHPQPQVAAPAVPEVCGHVWRDYISNSGPRNIVWCHKCDALAFAGNEAAAPQPAKENEA